MGVDCAQLLTNDGNALVKRAGIQAMVVISGQEPRGNKKNLDATCAKVRALEEPAVPNEDAKCGEHLEPRDRTQLSTRRHLQTTLELKIKT